MLARKSLHAPGGLKSKPAKLNSWRGVLTAGWSLQIRASVAAGYIAAAVAPRRFGPQRTKPLSLNARRHICICR